MLFDFMVSVKNETALVLGLGGKSIFLRVAEGLGCVPTLPKTPVAPVGLGFVCSCAVAVHVVGSGSDWGRG